MSITDGKLYFDINNSYFLNLYGLREQLINSIVEARMEFYPDVEIKLMLNSPGKDFNYDLYKLKGKEFPFDIEIGNMQLTVYISSYQTGRFDYEEWFHRRIYLSLTPLEEEEFQLELIPF